MTTVPNVSDAFVTKLLQEHEKEKDRATGVRQRLAEFGAWMHEKAGSMALDELHRAVDNLSTAVQSLAEAERLAADFLAVASHHRPPLPASAAVESSQPLAPVAEPGPDRTVPDEAGQLVATTSTIHTDTAPVDVQPKGGAK